MSIFYSLFPQMNSFSVCTKSLPKNRQRNLLNQFTENPGKISQMAQLLSDLPAAWILCIFNKTRNFS